MRICSLVSGSSGNSTYIEGSQDSILIDVGITKRNLEEQLREIDRKPEDIKGILITHEHTDHVKGLGVISRKYQIPIYTSSLTSEKVLKIKSLGTIDPELIKTVEKGSSFKIGSLEINPISVSHDAVDPLMYTVREGNQSCGVCMDLGTFDQDIIDAFSKVSALILEANYDQRMLEVGPYPFDLKRRIMGARGHLSNESSGQLLDKILHNHMQGIILGHLSKENNYDKLALETVKSEIDLSDSVFKSRDFDIQIAPREKCSRIIELK